MVGPRGRGHAPIGLDPFHTPLVLVEALYGALLRQGYAVAIDRPFAGALVPSTWHGRDRRVSALMIETRCGLYCDEASGRRTGDFERVAVDIERAMTETLQALG